jgi:formylglycine-generating enzyme required for sulfatase activity
MTAFFLFYPVSHTYAEPRAQEILEMISSNMVKVPGGTFMMWATPEKGEEKGHWVRVEPFLIGKHEVTQRKYEAVMGNNPSHFKGDLNLPVEQVSWNDAQEFIRRLNALEGAEVYRLPTEAEWEYICLADTTNDYGFCEDEAEIEDYAWLEMNSGGNTHPVGQRKANPWGLFDTHGNVWEWVQDWHGEHPPGAITEPAGLSPAFRVLRGGAWDSPTGNCRSHTRRSYSIANARSNKFGFRLAMTIPKRVPFQEATIDYPHLGEMVDEEGFNNLKGGEQQELMGMVDRYLFFLEMAERYEEEKAPSTSQDYSRRARSLKRDIESKFGHVLKE